MQINTKVSDKIVRNTVFNGIGYAWGILITILLTPYIITHIGVAKYGVWATLSVLTGYFGLLDLGLGQSFERYIAEYVAKRDTNSINDTVNAGTTFYLLLGIVFLVAGFLLTEFLLKLFRIPPALREDAAFVFRWGLVIFAFTNIFGAFTAVLRGFQRMDLSNKIVLFSTTINAIGAIFFLESGFGLKGLVANQLIVVATGGLASFAVSFNIFPQLDFHPFRFNTNIFSKLASFGLKRWLTSMEEVLIFQTDKIIISRFLGVQIVGLYQIGYSLAEKAFSTVRLLTSAIIPAASELHANSAKDSLKILYFRSTKYLWGIGLPIFLFLAIMATPIIEIWMGKPFPISANILRIFAFTFIAVIPALSSATIAVGIEHPEFQLIGNTCQVVLKLFLIALLLAKTGYWGIILSTLFSGIVSTLYIIRRFHLFFSITIREFQEKTLFLHILGFSLFVSTIFLFLQQYCMTAFFQHLSRNRGLLLLIVEFIIFIAIHGVFLIFRVFSNSDRTIVKKLLNFNI